MQLHLSIVVSSVRLKSRSRGYLASGPEASQIKVGNPVLEAAVSGWDVESGLRTRLSCNSKKPVSRVRLPRTGPYPSCGAAGPIAGGGALGGCRLALNLQPRSPRGDRDRAPGRGVKGLLYKAIANKPNMGVWLRVKAKALIE